MGKKEDCILGTKLTIPRQIDTSKNYNLQLHIFCDASEKAYGVAAYSGTANHREMIMSKTRVAPIKPRTLPQLELTAVEMGTRLAAYLLETTGIDHAEMNPNASEDPIGNT